MALRPNDLKLLVGLWVAEHGLEEEAVELGLGEGKNALVVERVLRGENEERARKGTRLTVDRDLPLCHRFEKRALSSRHGTVDLVDEKDVRERGARLEL